MSLFVFIHLGGSKVVSFREVIAILEVEDGEENPFVQSARQEGRLEEATTEEVKAYVITRDKVVASPISATTLKRRASKGYDKSL